MNLYRIAENAGEREIFALICLISNSSKENWKAHMVTVTMPFSSSTKQICDDAMKHINSQLKEFYTVFDVSFFSLSLSIATPLYFITAYAHLHQLSQANRVDAVALDVPFDYTYTNHLLIAYIFCILSSVCMQGYDGSRHMMCVEWAVKFAHVFALFKHSKIAHIFTDS